MAVSANIASLRPYFPARIDMSSLSHSELLSISLLSNSSSTSSLSSNDVVLCSAQFNESESSRRQTYSDHSRLRRYHRHRFRGGGGGFSLMKGEKSELSSIVDLLKQYLEIQLRNSSKKPKRKNEKKKKIAALLAMLRDREPHVPHGDENADVGVVDLLTSSTKQRETEVRNSPNSRKRKNPGAADGAVVGEADSPANSAKARKARNSRKEEKEKRTVEIVNRNGVVVDLTALVTADGENNGVGPYGEELRRRAEGKEREEELLKMLSEMEGEWCSRRKKRRIVNACLLGDALPVGWKLIIALRRKSGRYFPYCHRYISPTGEHLASCKEVASYLQSHFGITDTTLLRDTGVESSVNSIADCALVDVSNSAVPDSSMAIVHVKDVTDVDIDNLPEVHVTNLYECHPCNASFHEKDRYLQHMMSIHRSTTRRYHFGSCVEDSLVQMADSAKLPCLEWLPDNASMSPMDALIVAAECSMQESGPRLPEIELSASNRDKSSEIFEAEVADFMVGNKSVSCPSELEVEKISEVCTQSVTCKSCDKLCERSSDCCGKTEVENVGGKDGGLSAVSIPTFDEDKSISCLSELELEKRREDKIQSENQNSCDKLGGMSSDCHDKTEVEKINEKDRSSSVESIPTCDEVKSISYPSELEMEKRSGEVCIQSVMLKSCDELRGMPSDCTGKTEVEKINEKDRSSSVASIPTCDEDRSISCLSELQMEKRTEVKIQSENRNSCVKLSGISSDFPARTEVKDGEENDEAPPVFSIPTCDQISETTNGDINDTGAFSIGSGKGDGQNERSSKGQNPSVKVTAESVTDGNELGSTFDEFRMRKDLEQTSSVFAELSPLKTSGDILMAEAETRKEIRTYSRRVSVNNAGVGPMRLSAGKSGTDCIGACENDACSVKKEGSVMQHKVDPEEAQVYDDKEQANVTDNFTGGCHASDCAEPQKEMDLSLPFDEVSRKAGQYVCDHDQNIENETRTEYMDLDDIGPYLHNSMNGGDSISLLELSMESQSEFQLNMANQDMKLTCCVWCGIQFCHEMIDIELQSDSVGFMCPTCRNKISSQFSVLDSFDPHLF